MSRNLKNVLGTGIERFLKLPLQFFATTIVLRELGVNETGELAMVVATYLLVVSISANGLNQIYIKKVARSRSRKSVIVENYFFVQNLYVLVSLIFFFLYAVPKNIVYASFLIPILASQLSLLKARAEAERKLILVTPYETVLALLFALTKLYFAKDFSLETLVVFLAFEFSIYFLVPVFLFRDFSLSVSKLEIKLIRPLFAKSIWFVGIALSISIHMRIDQIMLYEMVGTKENGNYSALVRMIEALTSIFLVLIPTFNALIYRSRGSMTGELFGRFFKVGVIAIATFSLVFALVAQSAFNILYGSDFEYSSENMYILLPSILFIFVGTMSSPLYVKGNLEKYLFYNMLIAAFLNVVLNLLLIRELGATGASIATLFVYIYTGLIGDFLWRETRHIGIAKLRALVT